jgi:hypothetical protein
MMPEQQELAEHVSLHLDAARRAAEETQIDLRVLGRIVWNPVPRTERDVDDSGSIAPPPSDREKRSSPPARYRAEKKAWPRDLRRQRSDLPFLEP